MIAVIDDTDHLVRTFNTYKEADNFRIVNSRPDWKLTVCYMSIYNTSDYKSSDKQQAAVNWTSHILGIEFTDDINSGLACSEFLSQYLEIAKQTYNELKAEYETDRGY